MSRFEKPADAGRINGSGGDAHNVPDRSADTSVYGLIWFRLDQNLDVRVIQKHFVDGIDQILCRFDGTFGLCAKGSLACQPQNDFVGAKRVCDIDAAVCAPDCEFAVLFGRGHEAAVNSVGILPESRSDKFRGHTVFVENCLDFSRFRDNFFVA